VSLTLPQFEPLLSSCFPTPLPLNQMSVNNYLRGTLGRVPPSVRFNYDQ
jgi:hypothetical protein